MPSRYSVIGSQTKLYSHKDSAMRHSQTIRNSAKAFFAFAVLGLVGACADSSTVAPATEAPAFVAPANFSRVGNVVTFRVNNSEGITKKIGAHVLSIPAGAICDLLTSGYGASMWDKDCKPMRGSIVITATVLYDGDDKPYIDFQPAMRFAPNKEVMLFLRAGSMTKSALSINYCNNLGYCYDESLTDASLKPFRVGKTSIIGRRVKHFSGYSIATAGECAGSVVTLPSGELWCEGGEAAMTRRSGYMVASGEDVSEVMKDEKEGKKGDSQ
jgi:hypothetical protein